VAAHEERVRREGQVRSSAALWVIGLRANGYREHVGVWLGASESGASWRRVFEQLVQRGLSGVAYVVSDEHAGLLDALRHFFPDAVHQRRQVHCLRNALDHVSSELLRDQVKQGLRDVWAAPTRGDAEQRVVRLLDALRRPAPRLADWLEATIADTLAVYAHADRSAQRHLRSTNSVEHDHMAVRRRTRVIRVFPNDASLVRLLSALAMERNEQWLARRYLLPQDGLLKQESQPLAA
jgi:transposase-like protein